MSAIPVSTESVHGRFNSELFATHLGRLAGAPAWWLEAKKEAWNQFLALPMPSRGDELWRFSTLSKLTLDGFEPASSFRPSDYQGAGLGFECAARFVFANNVLVSRETNALPEGVIVEPLRIALEKHGDLVRKYLNQQHTNLGSEKFRALHTALVRDGLFVHVPAGVELAQPIAVFHHVAGEGAAIFPHTLVVAEDNAKATLVEVFASLEADAPQFASGVNDLFAGPGAQINYIAAQAWSSETLAFQNNAITAQRDARILSLNLHLGGRQARHESHSRLQGPGAHSEMLALTIAQGGQEFDQRTLQTHQAPNTSSNLLYKNALLDQARTIFSGLIIVEPDAQKTDAYQSNRNLMLSDEAEANSLPGLEIQANDVRCTHGATSGRIDAEQEFYLQSRGIPRKLADELLVAGFFEEVLEKVESESIREALRSLIAAKMRR
ncbi:FeS cluster assembly protein SufD [mine drainage metagenome]|uniref:FeS cluster assembly protein SufD n=1 Tax=mine drainage metagenome TaxID=410659 RepID=A0A1J5SDK3_9ZZZZ